MTLPELFLVLVRKTGRWHRLIAAPRLSGGRRVGSVHRLIAADIGLGIEVVRVALELALKLALGIGRVDGWRSPFRRL